VRDPKKNICRYHPSDHYARAGKNYEQQPLPVTRQEFENRSMLYHILEDMKAFIDIKKDFIKDKIVY